MNDIKTKWGENLDKNLDEISHQENRLRCTWVDPLLNAIPTLTLPWGQVSWQEKVLYKLKRRPWDTSVDVLSLGKFTVLSSQNFQSVAGHSSRACELLNCPDSTTVYDHLEQIRRLKRVKSPAEPNGSEWPREGWKWAIQSQSVLDWM